MPSRKRVLAEVLLEHAHDRGALLVGEDVEHALGVVGRDDRVLDRAGATRGRRCRRPAVRDRPKLTQRSQSGRNASVTFISMNVAKASLSQMPFHHFIVTRSPNHMWASSWAMTSATFCSSPCVAVLGVDEEQRLAERDAAEVLHGAEGEVGDGDEVELVAGVGDAEVVGEVAQRERADLEREGGEVALAGRADDAQRRAVDVDRLGDLERADDERHQVGRHRHRVGEAHRRAARRPPASSADLGARWRPRSGRRSTTSVTAKTALQSGSSQHGKARRASVASNWVVAMTCSSPSSSVKVRGRSRGACR